MKTAVFLAGALVGAAGALVGAAGALVGAARALVGAAGVLVGAAGALVGVSMALYFFLECGSFVGSLMGAVRFFPPWLSTSDLLVTSRSCNAFLAALGLWTDEKD